MKEADLCYHVFLDLGANIGVHCRFLFEPDKYPNATISKNVFNSQYGLKRDNRDICCFEFEANPMHYKSLQEKSNAYSKVGWRFYVKKFGVGDKNGIKTFYHQADVGYNEWGYTEMMTTMQTSPEKVNVLRIATWINDNVIDRKLPRIPFGNYSNGPKIVMKIDVEGSEYLILPDLFSMGVLCKLNFVFGEIHKDLLPSKIQSRVFVKSFMTMLKYSQNCEVNFRLLDDETYLYDGIPLPN